MVRDEMALMWPTLVARLLLGHRDVLPRIRLTSFVASRESYSLANSHSRFGKGRGINSSYSGSYFFVFLRRFWGGRIREYDVFKFSETRIR